MGASIIYMYINTVCKYKTFFFTSFGKMTFRVAISTEPDPQGTGRVDIPTHPYTPAAYAAGVVTKTTDKDSLLPQGMKRLGYIDRSARISGRPDIPPFQGGRVL